MKNSSIVLTALLAISLSGCFYDPDEDHIDLLYDAAPVETTDGGLGEICEDEAQCLDNAQATYCAPNMLDSTQPGRCTIANCAPGGCPEGYACCECPEELLEMSLCVDDVYVQTATQYGCSCS